MKTAREIEIDELKQLIAELPSLEKWMYASERNYLIQKSDNFGYEENGFVYNVQPSVWMAYINSKKYYEEANDRRWELIKKLELDCDINGNPDFKEGKIKPYGWDRVEPRNYNDNRPISLYS